MTFMTAAQFIQLGKKCCMCNEEAKWLDKFDENARAYCERHYPGRVCECEICKEKEKYNGLEKEIIQCCYCPNKFTLEVDKEMDLIYDICKECLVKL